MPGLKERAKTLVELADGASFLFAERPLAADEKAAALLQVDRSKDDAEGRAQGAGGRVERLERPPARKPPSASMPARAA